jgi:hypothetical protein
MNQVFLSMTPEHALSIEKVGESKTLPDLLGG